MRLFVRLPHTRLSLPVLFCLVFGLVVAGCSTSSPTSLNQDPADFEDEVEQLQAQISDDPTDAEALRDLGTIYMRTGRPNQAYATLKKAFQRDDADPQTLYFLGLATERVGKEAAARDIYVRYGEVPEDSRYRALMEGRLSWLIRQEARREARQLLSREAELADQDVSPDIVAVLPLRTDAANDRYARIGRGLAEMILTDLTHVRDLRLVERVRLQAILDELKLAQTDAVDASTAPRVGRLLGAGRIVSGSYFVSSDERIRMDLTIARADGAQDGGDVGTQVGDLSDLFRLQTALVYQIVNAFGIELTPQEREAIEPVPTQNLQAFLAYSQGLWEEDRGNFGAAVQQYERAQELDPTFNAPKQAQQRASGLSAAGGAIQNAVVAGVGTPQPIANGLVTQRAQRMSGFDPGGAPRNDDRGRDGRNLSEEVARTSDTLPLPPSPPDEQQ